MTGTQERLLSLLSLLQARRDWPGQLLAERLRISPRTVRRDVDRLRELGYPVHAAKGPYGGYRLDAGASLPPLLFDDEQAIALAVALRSAAVSGTAIGDGAARALATIRQLLPARLRHRVHAVQVTALGRGPGAGAGAGADVDPEVLVALSDAARAREVLRFTYTPPPGAPVPAPGELLPLRRVEPHHLVTRAARWYLVAFDLDRDDWRTFRADRIHPQTPTGPRFAPRDSPGGDVAAFVSARFRGSDGPDAWPCRGEVILDLPATEVAPYAAGGDGTVEPLGEHRCRLSLGAWSWAGLAASIGCFDADIEVLGPPPLKQAFADLARSYAAAGR